MVNLLALKIGEVSQTVWGDQVLRFFAFTDPSLVTGVVGCTLLGFVLNLLGSFMVLRKMSLMGDALGHAVLPGICLAFWVTGTKAFFPTLLGATASGLLGVLLIGWIIRYSRIKTDAAMGMILSSFFGFGVVLLTMIQKQGSGNQSGLDKFLFGQAAAMNSADLLALALVGAVTAILVFAFLKELAVVSFDENFARALRLPVHWIQTGLMVLTALAVVASIQAVGVVLVSAMLIIPPATASLFVKRLPHLLLLGSFFGMAAGFLGAFFSFLGPSLPTGPFMVVSAALFFCLAFVFAPRHGVLPRWLRQTRRRIRTERENLLKSVYHFVEQRGFQSESMTLEELAAFRSEGVPEVERRARRLVRMGWLEREAECVRWTPVGKRKARELVRKHRLWELFLVREAHLPADHVHADAEDLEHFLPPEVLRSLEESLDYASLDPHGKPIP